VREDGVVSEPAADVTRIKRIRNDRLANLTLRGAVFLIVLVATAMSVIAAVIERLIDPAFDDIGIALWWAVTTVTTVGYGDIVPESHAGRAAASVLMLTGLALIPTLTSIVVATLVAQRSAQERQEEESEFNQLVALLRSLDERLERLERRGDPAR
jgi:voltage-gated potassium channel